MGAQARGAGRLGGAHGSRIAFLSDRSGEWEFYVMDADGSNQRKILENVTEQLDIYYEGGNERVISWGR